MMEQRKKIAKITGFADFETLPPKGNENKDLVCAGGLKLSNTETFYRGISTSSFLERLNNLPKKTSRTTSIYFHNFSGFDGFFLLKMLPKLGFNQRKFYISKKIIKQTVLSKHKESNLVAKYEKGISKQYQLICNQQGKIIGLKMSLIKDNRLHFIKFKCSLLLYINQSLSALGEKVNLKKIDLDVKDNKRFKSLVDFENSAMFNYLLRDVDIVKKLFAETTKTIPNHRLKITIGATGYNEWLYHSKNSIERFYLKGGKKDGNTRIKSDGYEVYYRNNKKIFSTDNTKKLIEKILPVEWLKDYNELRKWFKGGMTMCHPHKIGRIYHNVFHADINSSYPSILASNNLIPWGEPHKGDGGVAYPCKFFKITAISILENKTGLPFIGFRKVKGIVLWYSSKIKNRTEIFITSAEMVNFKKYYTGLYKTECYLSFRGVPAFELFGEFITKYSRLKTDAKLSGDKILYLFSKLIQNSVYGKFATKTIRESKIFNPNKQTENGDELPSSQKTSFESIIEVEKATFYLPLGCGITALARQKLVDAVGSKYNENFVYCDTDSVFMTAKPMLDYDDTKLGAWAIESENASFMSVGKKRYLVKENGGQKIVMASFYINKELQKTLTFDDLINGFSVSNLHRREIKYGVELTEQIKELKPIGTENYERPDDIGFHSKAEFFALR